MTTKKVLDQLVGETVKTATIESDCGGEFLIINTESGNTLSIDLEEGSTAHLWFGNHVKFFPVYMEEIKGDR